MCNYNYKYLNIKNHVKPEESFMGSQVEECFEPENVRSSNKRPSTILDIKYEKAYLNKVMNKQ